jgi:hypothetical protein
MDDPIIVHLVETNFCTRRRCAICGGETHKDTWVAEFEDACAFCGCEDGHQAVCKDCIEAGAEAARERLRPQAGSLDAAAAHLRTLAERSFVFPSPAECQRRARWWHPDYFRRVIAGGMDREEWTLPSVEDGEF